MVVHDIFNGDADGICALHQLRLSCPMESTLTTGVKRDINLLAKITPQAGDQITVLDISLEKNRTALNQAINIGANITYYDHHYAGEIPRAANFSSYINTSSDTCTSLIVNQRLNNAYPLWAVVGAYGDNLHQIAENMLQPYNLNVDRKQQLKALGTVLNYNGYGIELNDLHIHPADLYQTLHSYRDPFSFIHEEELYQTLHNGYQNDLQKIVGLKPVEVTKTTAVVYLPNTKWAKRISGIYGNQLAQNSPDRAHAILAELTDGGFRISVRAPLNNKQKADSLCRRFKTGGGRAAAAGINALKVEDIDKFIEAFEKTYE